jgi:hypothetical protein
MPITVKHTKVSTIPDADDDSLIRPSDWNDDHALTGLGTAAELDAGVPNGVATLDAGGKVPVSELPAAVLGALSYQGTWDASTNTPTLTSSVGTKGYYYVVNVAGNTNLNGITDWLVGDWAVYNGTVWQKVDNTDAGGDVVGPASATDNAIARFDTTTGKLIQNSVTLIDDTGNASGILSQQFSNGSAVTSAAGKIWYNGSAGSWNAGMGGGNITQQIGEELFVYGKASAAITDSPLQIIYQTGATGASGVIQFAPTIAGITDGTLVIGVATENIANNGFGRITSYGVVRGITTNGTAFGETWVDGDEIYYNPVTGNPTNIKPVAPNVKVSVGTLIHAGAGGSGSIQVEINHGSVLGGTDANVQLTSVSNGQIISYDGGNGYWKNTDLTAGTGISISETVNGVLTVTNTLPSLGGTVTSVSGTAGRITSTGGTTPVIDLASGVATAGTTGSSSLIPVVTIDTYGRVTSITTAANPQGTVTSVTGTAPVVSSGGATPAISMAAATTSVNGYLTSTDWNTFNNKTSNTGTVTSVGGTGTVNGITLTGTVTTSGNLTLGGTLSNVSLATQVTGNLPVTNLNSGTSASALTFWRGDGTWATPAGAGTVTSVGQTFTGGLISVSGSPITTTGTLALTVAGTSGGIPYFSSASTWASSAALAANALVVGGGAGAAPSTITTGTGVATALGVNTGSAGAFVVNGGALGTPSSGTVTNLTGTASININGTVGATTANTGVFTTATANSFIPNLSTVPTNGMYLPAANTVGFATNSSEKVRVDSTGNVGIGTTDIYSRVNIQGSSIAAPTTGEANGVGALRIIGSPSALSDVNSGIEFKLAGDTNGYGSKIAAISSGGSNIVFASRNATATWTEQMRITPTGNVGIGTSSPATKLHVAGGDLRLNNDFAINWGGTGAAIIGSNNTLLRFDVNGSERMRIANSGGVSVGNTTDRGAGALSVANGIYAESTGPFHLNATTVSANFTIPTDFNASSAGPITVNTGITVTISTGSTWIIV